MSVIDANTATLNLECRPQVINSLLLINFVSGLEGSLLVFETDVSFGDCYNKKSHVTYDVRR